MTRMTSKYYFHENNYFKIVSLYDFPIFINVFSDYRSFGSVTEHR